MEFGVSSAGVIITQGALLGPFPSPEGMTNERRGDLSDNIVATSQASTEQISREQTYQVFVRNCCVRLSFSLWRLFASAFLVAAVALVGGHT